MGWDILGHWGVVFDFFQKIPEEEDAESQLLSRLARCVNTVSTHGLQCLCTRMSIVTVQGQNKKVTFRCSRSHVDNQSECRPQTHFSGVQSTVDTIWIPNTFQTPIQPLGTSCKRCLPFAMYTPRTFLRDFEHNSCDLGPKLNPNTDSAFWHLFRKRW